MSIFKNTFKPEIKEQLKIRQDALGNRTSKSIIYTNTRNSWVRMVSSVDVNNDGGKLASNYILQGGTLSGKNLRSGVNNNNSAYNTNTPGGKRHERGIRPMPGITSIDIKSKSAYGSLREVTVNFQCWDITQLEDLELLYMRPGYTVLIEWGWLPYINNKNDIVNNITPYDKMFSKGTTKETIWSDIFQKTLDSNGNYDAMFGYVKNYSWSARPDGGYDCTTSIISIGEVLESLKINYSPQNLKIVKNGTGLIYKNISEGTAKRFKKNILAGLFSELYEKVDAFQEGSEDGNTFQLTGNDYFVLNKQLSNNTISEGDDDQLINKNATIKQIYIRLGSLIDILNKYIFLKDKKGNSPFIKFSLKEREYDKSLSSNNPEGYLLCLAHPIQLSADPTICYIKTPLWKDIKAPTDENIDNTNAEDVSRFSNTNYDKEIEQINKFVKMNDFSSNNENEVIKIFKSLKSKDVNELSELNLQTIKKYGETLYELIDGVLNSSEIDQILTEDGTTKNSSLYNERKKAIETNFVEELKEEKEKNKDLLENASSQSKYLNSTAKDFFINNDPYSELGIISNIYVNLQFLYSLSLNSSLESQDKKEKQEISAYDFLKNLMSQVSNSIGNINTFDIHIDPIDNIARIIDINYTDELAKNNIYKNAFVLEIQGTNSTVRSYKLESQIFPEQSTIIAIGAQAKGGALGVNSNTMIDFNKNVIDRILPEKVDANITKENEVESTREQLQNLKENLKIIYEFIGDTTGLISFNPYTPQFDVSNADSYKGALRDIISYFQAFTKSKSKNRAIIPTKLSLEMDGIGGLVIGHLFRIPENLLPKGYKGLKIGSKLGYIITGINHNINEQDWKTGIEAQTIILDEPLGENIVYKEFINQITLSVTTGNIDEAIENLENLIPIELPKGVKATTEQINAMRIVGNNIFFQNGEVPGLCAKYSYSIAYWYISVLRNKTPKNIGTLLSAGGNANQKGYRDNLKKLGYTEYYMGKITKQTLLNQLKTYEFSIGDIAIYWSATPVKGYADVYGHTQIYTAKVLSKSRNISWATSNGNNYGIDFVYRSTDSNQWYFYIFKAPQS